MTQPETQARRQPAPQLEEASLQLKHAADLMREQLAAGRHFLTGGSGVLVEVDPDANADLAVLATRALAAAHPGARADVGAGVLGMLKALCVSAKTELLEDESHSDKQLIASAYDALIERVATQVTVNILMTSAGAILDSRLILAVRHDHAIVVDGQIYPLNLVGGVYVWPEDAPHCDACGDRLTLWGDEDERPVIQRLPQCAPAVACESCGNNFEIQPRIARVGVRR